MAFAYVAERGIAGSLVAAINPTATIAVGRFAILLCAWTGGTTISSVTDNVGGNTWLVDRQRANGSFASFGIVSCRVTNAILTSNTITINGADMAGSGHGIMLEEFSGVLASGTYTDVSADNVGADSTTATTGTTGVTAQADELAIECSVPQATGYTFTKDAAYTYFTTHESNRTGGAYKILSATGTQSATCAWVGAGVNWVGGIVTYKADVGGGAAVRELALSGVGT